MFHYTSGTNRKSLERVRASFGDGRVLEKFGILDHLKFVKEGEAWDEGQPCNEELVFNNRSAEGARDTTGRARFEDSASEE